MEWIFTEHLISAKCCCEFKKKELIDIFFLNYSGFFQELAEYACWLSLSIAFIFEHYGSIYSHVVYILYCHAMQSWTVGQGLYTLGK